MMFLRLLTLALTAVVLVPSWAHLFEMPHKITLDREAYFTVQAIYAGWAWFVIPIIAAIVLNGALFAIERRRNRVTARAALISALLIIASLGVFFVWVFPANQATVNWTQVPDNWQELRRQWEYGHAANALIVFVALLATGRAILMSPAKGV
jgi:membrane protease YdiL (CAAX protease family)